MFVSPANADEITCNAGAVSVPVFDPSSLSGRVGDYTLDCTGGTPVSPPPLVNFSAFMNVQVLNTGGWILTDGVNDFAGSLADGNLVTFLSVPFNPPGAGHLDWKVENIFVNPTMIPPGSEFLEDVEIAGQLSPTIVNPVQVVAVNAIPEPSPLLVAGMILSGIVWLSRRRCRA
jgi:hypothetical protein